MENVILHDFEMSFKQAFVIFYFIGTLKLGIRMKLLDNLLIFIYFTSPTRGLKNISVYLNWGV